MSLQPFDRFWWNLARWRTLVPYSGPTVKISNFWKTKTWKVYHTRQPPTSIIPTKFEVDITIHCRVIAFLSAHTSRDLDLLTLNSWRTWQVTWLTLPPSLNTLCLSVLDLWVITFPFGYHWECVRGHCACTESRDPWVGGPKQLHFWNDRPRFAYSLYNFFWATTTIKGLLLSSITNAKALDCINFLCVTLWPWPFAL